MGSLTDDKPPVPRYRFTLTVTGNTFDEVESELVSQTRGGFRLDSDYYKRDDRSAHQGQHSRGHPRDSSDPGTPRVEIEMNVVLAEVFDPNTGEVIDPEGQQ